MSRGVNKVILVGTLGADPEVRYTSSGSAVANLRLATNESWKDKTTDQWQERTEWHRVVLFGRTAEVAQEYLKKGSQVYIEGKIRTQKWQDKEGHDRYTTEILGNEMQMLGGRPGPNTAPFQDAQSAASPPPQPTMPPSPPPSPAAPSNSTPAASPANPSPDAGFTDDDIPF